MQVLVEDLHLAEGSPADLQARLVEVNSEESRLVRLRDLLRDRPLLRILFEKPRERSGDFDILCF